MIKHFGFFILLLLFSCDTEEKDRLTVKEEKIHHIKNVNRPHLFENILEDTVNFKNISVLDPDIVKDIRYADTFNFTGIQIYDCPACFLQNEAAYALVKAQSKAKSLGLGLKVFDCYRAYDYQVKLYEAFPNFNYVAKPSKGSMHSLGCAVDLTLVDSLGQELDMGTPFDSFDKKSHTYSTQIDSLAIQNRLTLIGIMQEVGFKEIRTEWWHFSFKACKRTVDDNLKWTCP